MYQSACMSVVVVKTVVVKTVVVKAVVVKAVVVVKAPVCMYERVCIC